MSASRSSSSALGARADRDTDARRDAQVRIADLERLLQRIEQALGDQLGSGGQRDLFGDHDEFITADARQRVRATAHAIESQRQRAQDLIAGAVAKRVVDALEVVNVDRQHRDGRLVAARAHDHLLAAVDDPACGWAGPSGRRASP